MSDWKTEFDPRAIAQRGSQARAKAIADATAVAIYRLTGRREPGNPNPVVPCLCDDEIAGQPGRMLDLVNLQMGQIEWNNEVACWHRAALCWLVYTYHHESVHGRGTEGVREFCRTWPRYYDEVLDKDNSLFRQDKLAFMRYFPDHVNLQTELLLNPPASEEDKQEVIARWEERGMRDLRVPGVCYSYHVDMRNLVPEDRVDLLQRLASKETTISEARKERRELLGKGSSDPELQHETDIATISPRTVARVEEHVTAVAQAAVTTEEIDALYRSVVATAQARRQEEQLFAALEAAGLAPRFVAWLAEQAEFYDDRLPAEQQDDGRRLELG